MTKVDLFDNSVIKALEDSIESKVIAIRDGSCSYTANEQCQNLIDEACAILGVSEQDLAYGVPEDDPDYDESEKLEANSAEYEDKLASAGYTVIWNDGFIIYKDLTETESDYLAEACC